MDTKECYRRKALDYYFHVATLAQAGEALELLEEIEKGNYPPDAVYSSRANLINFLKEAQKKEVL